MDGKVIQLAITCMALLLVTSQVLVLIHVRRITMKPMKVWIYACGVYRAAAAALRITVPAWARALINSHHFSIDVLRVSPRDKRHSGLRRDNCLSLNCDGFFLFVWRKPNAFIFYF